jgi:F420-non-reducing hydrogenase small subunit
MRKEKRRWGPMADKPKVIFYWCASCGGCEESIVDLAEDILMVIDSLDIVMWPVALDFKKHDIEKMPAKSVLISMINGAIRTSEQEEMAHMLRQKSTLVMAYGSCAQTGGVPGLANQFTREDLFRFVFEDCHSVVNERKVRPEPSSHDDGNLLTLPVIHSTVRSLDQVIDVDCYLPGCPPTPRLLKEAVLFLLSGKVPPKGAVLAPDVALCDECPRKDTKPLKMSFDRFTRPHMKIMDPGLCFLAQELICMGPATRGGCEALCILGNMPCTGCFGGTSRTRDQGAKILSCIASSVSSTDEKEIDDILGGIPDPLGTFYRYGLARSLLRKKLMVT